MPWNIKEQDSVVIVEMNSNKANLHNPEFFADFHQAIDQIEAKYPELPLILTGTGPIFSAGIDFNYCFELFGKEDVKAVGDWFALYQAMMVRLFELPRITIAAVNGHTFAGGAILALCCDFRIGAQGNYKISINEVPVGVPMPSVYTEIIRYRLGNPAATETILTGDIYSFEEGQKLGLLKKIVPADQLISACIEQAKMITPDCYVAYRHSKKMLQYPTMQAIRTFVAELEPESFKNICAPESRRAHRAAFARLMKS